jgi:hypothetical protein
MLESIRLNARCKADVNSPHKAWDAVDGAVHRGDTQGGRG